MEFQFSSFPGILISILFIFFVIKISKRSKPNSANLPPGPKKLPIIGNLHNIIGDERPHHIITALAKKYGSVMHLQLGEVIGIVISSSEAAKEVMKTHDITFAERPALLSAQIITYGSTDVAFAPYGEYWRQLRKICTLELLSAKRVQSFRSIREEEAANLVHTIGSKSGLPFNFSEILFLSAYGVTSRISFGKKCKDQEAFTSLASDITKTGAGFDLADVYPSIKFLQVISGLRSKLERLSREADRIFENIIRDHRSRKEGEKGSDEEDDLIDVLLKLQSSGGLEFTLTDDNIKAVILDVFIAGSETSSTLIEWTMSEMLKNPRVMQKAQEEVRKVFDKKGKVDEADLHELEYLKMVIKETLRIHPPLPFLLPRECRERCEIHGYEIPAKSRILVNAWAIGRDPNYWTEPETFYPERFLGSSVDFKGNSFELIPFGAGRRICPGILFGVANVEALLANFLYHFDWNLPGGLKPETLDMAERAGSTVRRENDLNLIATPHHASCLLVIALGIIAAP